MKKFSIYLFLWFLWGYSLGQGTAYFMKSNYNNPPKFIRKYDNYPGAHVTLSADIISGQKELAGLTDIYSNYYYYYSQITDKNVFWKDAMGTTAMGPCLLLDILPLNNTTPVPEVVQNYPCGLSYVYLINAISTTYPANQANITPICH